MTLATIFVVDTYDFVIMSKHLVKGCVFPAYRFDNEYHAARRACEDIATMKNKLVMNIVYSESDPLVYRPTSGEVETNTDDDYRSKLKGIIA
jgi:hypothetical protein